MSDWFFAGLYGGIGYALSGVIVVGIIVLGLVLYSAVRIVLDVLHIKEWRP